MDELTSVLRRLKDQLSIANRRAEAAERDLKGAKAFQPKIKPKPQNELDVDGQGMGVSKKEMDDKIKAFGEEMKKEWEAKVKKLELRLEKATNEVKAERNRALDLTTEIEELKAQVAAFEKEKAERELQISFSSRALFVISDIAFAFYSRWMRKFRVGWSQCTWGCR